MTVTKEELVSAVLAAVDAHEGKMQPADFGEALDDVIGDLELRRDCAWGRQHEEET